MSKSLDITFSEETIWKVWGKGQIVGGNDPVYWRMDMCGAWMFRGHYGIKNSEYGWKINYVIPLDKGDTNDVSNLIPLHWENTVQKSDASLNCRITAESYRNVISRNKPLVIFRS